MPDDKNEPPAPAKPRRDPAKHSKKDPAKPTRAKAAREQLRPIAPALEQLLNPGIAKGTAGPGSQTRLSQTRLSQTGPQPPPRKFFHPPADFAQPPKARQSTPSGVT